jgi:hypothetical protein
MANLTGGQQPAAPGGDGTQRLGTQERDEEMERI